MTSTYSAKWGFVACDISPGSSKGSGFTVKPSFCLRRRNRSGQNRSRHGEQQDSDAESDREGSQCPRSGLPAQQSRHTLRNVGTRGREAASRRPTGGGHFHEGGSEWASSASPRREVVSRHFEQPSHTRRCVSRVRQPSEDVLQSNHGQHDQAVVFVCVTSLMVNHRPELFIVEKCQRPVAEHDPWS